MPRNFDDKELSINVPIKKIETFTADEIQTFLTNATERTQLYILLMLNCGMTQQDISDVAQEEVDWTMGRIIRKRSKTGEVETVPTVNYLLWDQTFDLLKKSRSNATQVLINENGSPLRFRHVKEDGRGINLDNIKCAYVRLVTKLGLKDAKPPKFFRKTSASELEKHETYGRFSQYFLGHAPRSVAEKHYAKPSDELFDKAVIWLGERYGLKTLRTALK